MTGDGAPLVGWRLWRLRKGRLHSWTLDHVWDPGPNHASCIAFSTPAISQISPRDRCPQSPGNDCACGLWALWDLGRCLTKGRSERWRGGSAVVGLISGWGTVAVHGDEGFRCQHARIILLFGDSVWNPAVDPLVKGSGSITLR